VKNKLPNFKHAQARKKAPLKTKTVPKAYFALTIPLSWQMLYLKKQSHTPKLVSWKKTIFIYSKTYFFKVPTLPFNYYLYYDKNTQSIFFEINYFNSSEVFFWKYLRSLYYILHFPVFKKLKFKGKGYYMFKNKRGTIAPQFGFSHRIYLYSFFTKVIFFKKTHIFLFGFYERDILKLALQIRSVRPINMFTGRGIRFHKQLIYKKAGKISTYR